MTMLRSLGLGASIAATSVSAIMIPSTMSVTGDNPDAMAMVGVDPFHSLIKAECQGCLYAKPIENNMVMWTEGVNNGLLVDVSISDDMKSLKLNGAGIYPQLAGDSVFGTAATPYFRQIPDDISIESYTKNPQDYSLPQLKATAWGYGGADQPTEDGKDTMVTLTIRVDALEGQSVNVPEIVVTLLKDNADKLMILKTETKEKNDNDVPALGASGAECHAPAFVCKWRDILSAQMSAFREKFTSGKSQGRPCNKHKGMQHNPGHPHTGHPHGPPHGFGGEKHEGWEQWAKEMHKHHGAGFHHGNHPHHGHHHGHGPHHPIGRFMHFIAGIFMSFFLPMLLGMVLGFTLVAISAGLAKLIQFAVARRAQRRGQYLVVATEEADVDDDATVFDGDEEMGKGSVEIEKGEAPPAYDAVEGH